MNAYQMGPDGALSRDDGRMHCDWQQVGEEWMFVFPVNSSTQRCSCGRSNRGGDEGRGRVAGEKQGVPI